MVKRIYIAGPMRGIELFNFPAFDAARDHLSGQGFAVVSPADLDRESGFDPETLRVDGVDWYVAGYDWLDLSKIDFDLEAAMERDIKAIKSCDAIYMLTGWQNSRGARAEKALAEWMDKEVLYEDSILSEAITITGGDRQASYGPPDQDFRRTAEFWTTAFEHLLRDDAEFQPDDIAKAMILLKLSRQTHQQKRDNWVDIAGYAHCGQVCHDVAAERIDGVEEHTGECIDEVE